jgi:hypothetical protein
MRAVELPVPVNWVTRGAVIIDFNDLGNDRTIKLHSQLHLKAGCSAFQVAALCSSSVRGGLGDR